MIYQMRNRFMDGSLSRIIRFVNTVYYPPQQSYRAAFFRAFQYSPRCPHFSAFCLKSGKT